jgi:hypothetical protein
MSKILLAIAPLLDASRAISPRQRETFGQAVL